MSTHIKSSNKLKTGLVSQARTDAPAPPEPRNEAGSCHAHEATNGGRDPRLVIRGESLSSNYTDDSESHELFSINNRPVIVSTPLPNTDAEPYGAITDFLNCTFPLSSDDLDIFFPKLFNCLGKAFAPAIDRQKGLHGWNRSFALGQTKAFFAIGGQNGTGFLSLPGEACHMVLDWSALVTLIRDDLKGRITRWDGAVDDYNGLHSVDYAVNLYLNKSFNAGGNTPTCNQRGNWIAPDGSGRTFYIGKRENGKMARIYEKGMQLGAKWHPWVRWEVELHNIDRFIPWDVLLEPGRYVAGAYPKALGWVNEEMTRIKTIREATTISYGHLTHYAGVAYGKLIDVMLKVEGSEEKVIQKLRRFGTPNRLKMPEIPPGEGRNK